MKRQKSVNKLQLKQKKNAYTKKNLKIIKRFSKNYIDLNIVVGSKK